MKRVLVTLLICLVIISLIFIWDIKLAEKLLDKMETVRYKERKNILWWWVVTHLFLWEFFLMIA